jgi:hypothetical protein
LYLALGFVAACGGNGANSSSSTPMNSAGAGMNGGAGSGNIAPAHVVGNCDGLGEVDQFEEITPPGVNLSGNGIVHVMLDPVHSGVIYCGTDENGLFKSTDCGSTWAKMNTGTNGALLDSGILWVMAIDYTNPDVLYAGSLYGTDKSLLRSLDGGIDWDSMFPAGSLVANTVQYNFFQSLDLDPTDHQHLVVSFHADCLSGGFGPECLAQTKDGGATWTLFKGPLSGWQEASGPYVLNSTTWLLSTPQSGLFYTADSGGTWENVGPGTNLSFYKAADDSYYAASDYGVLHSPDAHVWTKIDASPTSNGLVGDGVRLFTSKRDADTDQQPYFTAPESDSTTWTPYASPKLAHGGHYLRFDADHHLMYSANTTSGLWRVVTR